MAKDRASNRLFGWAVHGIDTENGQWNSDESEYYTECPLCLATSKFYINPEKAVFDCKVCGKRGGYVTFLKEIHHKNQDITDVQLQVLAVERGLPIDAFRGLGIGWNGRYFTIPVYDVENNFIGLDYYKPGDKIWHSPKPSKTSLHGAEHLKEHFHGPIFICEGFWDMVAMRWLLKEVDVVATVVAVPGAAINIEPWVKYMTGKKVITLYDNDHAGREGEFRAYQALNNDAAHVSYIHWPPSKLDKYDIRDHIVKWIAEPKKAYHLILKWLHDVPRQVENMAKIDNQGNLDLERRTENLKPISFQELVKCYQELLYMPNIDPIRIMLGTIFANRFQSDMVWMFLVAPPSSGKSELIMTLQESPQIEFVSTLSEHALVSGFIGVGGADVSLLKKMNNRIMAIKDFTPLLQTIPQKRDAIFSVLRDAYDGRVDSIYGHDTKRSYKGLRFGIIAGVTPEIENMSRLQTSLGERFLRYYLPKCDQNEINKKVEGIIGTEEVKRKILTHNTRRFLDTAKTDTMPLRPEKIQNMLRNIADFTVALRAVVPRDFKERVQYTPSIEGSSRVNKQMTLLAMGIAKLENKPEIGDDEVRLIREVALSSCPDVVRSVVKAIYQSKFPVSQHDLITMSGFPIGTLRYVLEDLKMLGLVHKKGTNTFKSFYTLTDRLQSLIENGKIWPLTQSLNQHSNGLKPHLYPKPSLQLRLPKKELPVNGLGGMKIVLRGSSLAKL